MGKKRARYENIGQNRIKSVYEVNFREPEEIVNILESFRGNEKMEEHLVPVFLKFLEIFDDYQFKTEEQRSIVDFALKTVSFEDESFGKIAKIILRGIAPGEALVKSEIVREFLNYILSVPVQDQVDAYKVLGNELNKVLYEQTIGVPNIQQIDLQQLLNTSHTNLYKTADPRLKAFIEAAVQPVNIQDNVDLRNSKRNVFCSNIIENFLKARNMKFVSLSGLALSTLVYIYSGRSKQTCNLFSATGAKGSYKLVNAYVLPNSKETSYKHCIDGVTVFYSFDNAQKLFKTWRLHGSADKSLAMVTTSIGMISQSMLFLQALWDRGG